MMIAAILFGLTVISVITSVLFSPAKKYETNDAHMLEHSEFQRCVTTINGHGLCSTKISKELFIF